MGFFARLFGKSPKWEDVPPSLQVSDTDKSAPQQEKPSPPSDPSPFLDSNDTDDDTSQPF